MNTNNPMFLAIDERLKEIKAPEITRKYLLGDSDGCPMSSHDFVHCEAVLVVIRGKPYLVPPTVEAVQRLLRSEV